MKMFEKAMGVLGRRPWLPAAVYLVLYGLFVVTILVAGSNMIPGQFRLWEEFDKADLAIVARIGGAIAIVMVVYAMLLVVVPLLFLMNRGVRFVTLRVWGYGVGAILASIALAFLIAPIVFVGCLELDSAEREKGDEIEEVRDWTNGTECGPKNDYQYPRARYQFVAHKEGKGVYDLFDRRVRRVVAKDVVRWEERDEWLRFVTKDGTRYFMAYWEGRIRHYPDPEGMHGKSKKDEVIFERLKVKP